MVSSCASCVTPRAWTPTSRTTSRSTSRPTSAHGADAMPMVRTLQRSFAGGEIAPEMAGRLDIDKFQTGLKTCRNFEVLPHGPARNRAGFEYVLEAKDST